MEKCNKVAGLLRSGNCLMVATLAFFLFSNTTSALEERQVQAMPDYGSNDCVSFKHGADTNPLNFIFGYACVSENYCEVSAHGCLDESCQHTDYSRGVRTTLTNITMTSRVDAINMGMSGKDLASKARWCLVQDGAGNYWALDKQRGNSELFNLHNRHETLVPCNTSDYFRSDLGCLAEAAL